MIKNNIFMGSAVAIVTPFKNGAVDFDALAKLIEFQIENGTKAIVVLGTTGEPATMTAQEKKEVIEFAIEKIKGRVKVIIGTGGNNTVNVIADSLFAKNAGADALLVVTPYYNKCTQNGLIAHYTEIIDKVQHPIILYNVPGRTGVNMLPDTVAKLAENKWVVGVKEACGNFEQICELAIKIKNKTALYSGDDSLNYPMFCIGAVGVISVSANAIPSKLSTLCDEYLIGNIEVARAIHEQIFALNKVLFIEVSPSPVKALMAHLGLIQNELRLPLVNMEKQNYEKLIKIYEELIKND